MSEAAIRTSSTAAHVKHHHDFPYSWNITFLRHRILSTVKPSIFRPSLQPHEVYTHVHTCSTEVHTSSGEAVGCGMEEKGEKIVSLYQYHKVAQKPNSRPAC